MKTILALLISLQSSIALADTSALTELKDYLTKLSGTSIKANYTPENKQLFQRNLSPADFVEIFNATVSLCKAEVSGSNVIISEINSRSLVLGAMSLEIPFSGASISNKTYVSSVSYSDETPIYYQSPKEIVVEIAGEHPLRYEMNFSIGNRVFYSNEINGSFHGKAIDVQGFALDPLYAPGSVRSIQCEPNGHLPL